MNKELFSKLWTQAKENSAIAGVIFFPAVNDEFARLIVQECRDIIEQDMKLAHIQMIPLTLEMYANGRLKRKIQEHFGVEQ